MGNILQKEEEIIIISSVKDIIKHFLKEAIILWYDPNVNSDENKRYLDDLKTDFDIKTFTDLKEASNYIQTEETFCQVITSGTNGESLVQEIWQNPKVSSIYVFCSNVTKHKTWAQKYPKIVCVENRIENLLKELRHNFKEWQQQASSLKVNFPNFAPLFNDIDKSDILYQHLHLKGLINFKNRAQGKKDFLNLAKAIYKDKKNMKDFSKNYEEYNKKAILNWYTRESFLYKVPKHCTLFQDYYKKLQ